MCPPSKKVLSHIQQISILRKSPVFEEPCEAQTEAARKAINAAIEVIPTGPGFRYGRLYDKHYHGEPQEIKLRRFIPGDELARTFLTQGKPLFTRRVEMNKKGHTNYGPGVVTPEENQKHVHSFEMSKAANTIRKLRAGKKIANARIEKLEAANESLGRRYNREKDHNDVLDVASISPVSGTLTKGVVIPEDILGFVWSIVEKHPFLMHRNYVREWLDGVTERPIKQMSIREQVEYLSVRSYHRDAVREFIREARVVDPKIDKGFTALQQGADELRGKLTHVASRRKEEHDAHRDTLEELASVRRLYDEVCNQLAAIQGRVAVAAEALGLQKRHDTEVPGDPDKYLHKDWGQRSVTSVPFGTTGAKEGPGHD